ncbi:hypothetical protein ASG42_25755 [Rhizobium sp. Leaf391]|nr:hypothetical protein ASG42_25755 [Rhizobium sp. Leaf391]
MGEHDCAQALQPGFALGKGWRSFLEIMKRFKSARHLQRFVSIHDPIANLFHIPRHDIPSSHHHELRAIAMEKWHQIARLRVA